MVTLPAKFQFPPWFQNPLPRLSERLFSPISSCMLDCPWDIMYDKRKHLIVLDKGKIVEEGTYEALIEKNGFFAELVARQRLDTETE